MFVVSQAINVESLKQSAAPPSPPLAASGSQEATVRAASLTILTKTSGRTREKKEKMEKNVQGKS
jgi:hypothetical protein